MTVYVAAMHAAFLPHPPFWLPFRFTAHTFGFFRGSLHPQVSFWDDQVCWFRKAMENRWFDFDSTYHKWEGNTPIYLKPFGLC